MKFIQGIPRTQATLFASCLDDAIEPDNEVRLIDAFVDTLKLEEFGFKLDYPENGRPAYHPARLLKLFIYGYLNRIRSSRCLERECRRNIEVMWLINSLKPDHNTIANFRRANPKAIKQVFRVTVQMAKHFQLIGGSLIAGDSTRMRAQNSKKHNYNEKKIQRHLAYIDRKLEEYTAQLSQADGDGGEEKKQKIEKKIEQHQQRKKGYEPLEKELKSSGEKQISTSDPESRQLMIRNNISEVAYNVQTTVDAQHCLPIDYEVTNQNDAKALGGMVRRVKRIVGNSDFTALFDKGYHTGSELAIAQGLGIRTLVAIPAVPSTSQSPDPAYNVEHFQYCQQTDTYQCPQGHILTTNGSWYNGEKYRFKQYKTSACQSCSVKPLCSTARYGKIGQRSEYTPAVEQNKKWLMENPDLYKQRQAIVEHPFGTIKRQWGFDYILTKKGMQRASADVGCIFIAYNLRRIINIIEFEVLMAYLKVCIANIIQLWTLYPSVWSFLHIWSYVSFKFRRSSNFLTQALFLNYKPAIADSF